MSRVKKEGREREREGKERRRTQPPNPKPTQPAHRTHRHALSATRLPSPSPSRHGAEDTPQSDLETGVEVEVEINIGRERVVEALEGKHADDLQDGGVDGEAECRREGALSAVQVQFALQIPDYRTVYKNSKTNS